MTAEPKPLDSFDDANREIVRALRSGDPDARAMALTGAAEMLDDPLAEELLRFARDPAADVEERGHALIALGPSLELCFFDERDDGSLPELDPEGDPWWDLPLSDRVYRSVRDELRKIYHDAAQPKEVRRRALEAAVRSPRDWQRDAAAAAWRSDDPEWRITAVFAMGYLDGFEEEITEAFRQGEPPVATEAIRAAGRSHVETLGPAFLALAADETAETPMRLAAIEAVGELSPEGAFEVLDDLEGDPDPEVAEAAEAALDELAVLSALDEDDDLMDDLEDEQVH